MSKYTTQLRWPIEQRLDDLHLAHAEANWPSVYEMLGLHDYPIFEAAYRQELNDKIIRAYYFREIGFETLGQFAWQVRRTMFEIMPYYNQLYKSEGLVTDPLLSQDLTYEEAWTRDEKWDGHDQWAANDSYSDEDKWSRDETVKNSSATDATSASQSTSDDRNVFQDTPMNGLDTGAVEAMQYATNVTFDHGATEGGSSSKTETSGTTTGDYDYSGTKGHMGKSDRSGTSGHTGDYDGTKRHEQKGFDGSQSDLLLTYRKTFLNIDLQIVDSLGALFMGLW